MATDKTIDYNMPLLVAEGVFWVGFSDIEAELYSNPYLLIEGDEAVLLDGGSRPDFSEVMMRILRTGIVPGTIRKLIYHHYDPDLCASIPHLEQIIGRDDLEIISHTENNVYIKYYGARSPLRCILEMNGEFRFRTGRTLRFYQTPYSHSAGSFMTFDERTGTLFSSDLFGSYDTNWEFKLSVHPECLACEGAVTCERHGHACQVQGIRNFHRRVMTSCRALRYALGVIESLPVELVAPQHGSIIEGKENVGIIIGVLRRLEDVGIDGWNG